MPQDTSSKIVAWHIPADGQQVFMVPNALPDMDATVVRVGFTVDEGPAYGTDAYVWIPASQYADDEVMSRVNEMAHVMHLVASL